MAGETKEIFRNPVSREAARLTGCKNFSKARRIDAHTAEAEDWGVYTHYPTGDTGVHGVYRLPGARLSSRSGTLNVPGRTELTRTTAAHAICCRSNRRAALNCPLKKNYYIKNKSDECAGSCRESACRNWRKKECRIIWHLTRKNCCFSGKENMVFRKIN